jgi:hypothetical protein
LVISPFGPLNLFRVSGFGFRISPPWIACLLTSALATLLNPYGPDVYRYAGQLSALGVARGIEEWLPPSPVSLVGVTFVLSVAAAAALVWRARRSVTLRDVCLLAVFAVPACFSVRMTVWWFLAAAPVAARLVVLGAATDRCVKKPRRWSFPLSPVRWGEGRGEGLCSGRRQKPLTLALSPGYRGEGTRARFLYPSVSKRDDAASVAEPDRASLPSWRAALALVAILSVCVLTLPWLGTVSPLYRGPRSSHRTEDDLQAFVPALTQSSRDARVFSRMEWSNYLAWATAGRAKVFVEGHVELYPESVWSDFTTVNDARPGWPGVLDRHGVTHLVLDPTYHARLLSELRKTNDWRLRATSGGAILFERSPGK